MWVFWQLGGKDGAVIHVNIKWVLSVKKKSVVLVSMFWKKVLVFWKLFNRTFTRSFWSHLAHKSWCSLVLHTLKPTSRSGTDLLFSSHGLSKCLLWAVYRAGLCKALYANELLINYLLNLPSQGGRRLEDCSAAPCPLSSCLPSIKASLPGDWFRRLVAPQANAKIIYLSRACAYEAGR